MLRDLLPLFTALAVAAMVYVFREVRLRRQRSNPKMPGVTAAEVWQFWQEGLRNTADSELGAGRTAPSELPDPARESIRAALLEAESWCVAADHPRLAWRRLVLDHAAMSLHLEAVSEFGGEERRALLQGYEPGMDELLNSARLSSAVVWLLLRLYGQLKYDDTVAGDWFHHFLHLARPYIREKVRLARDHILRMDEGSGRIVEVYDQLLDELRGEVLAAKPKKRFVAPDLS